MGIAPKPLVRPPTDASAAQRAQAEAAREAERRAMRRLVRRVGEAALDTPGYTPLDRFNAIVAALRFARYMLRIGRAPWTAGDLERWRASEEPLGGATYVRSDTVLRDVLGDQPEADGLLRRILGAYDAHERTQPATPPFARARWRTFSLACREVARVYAADVAENLANLRRQVERVEAYARAPKRRRL